MFKLFRGQWWSRGGLYLNTFRAFFRVNRQLIFVGFWLARRFQALVSRRNVFQIWNPPFA